MYKAYFGLTERPFSIAPDPQYLYMSTRHKEAMAHLSYGLTQGGCFIVLTGEVGTGKTTLCRNLLAELPEGLDVALILNANINRQELLQTICDELQIDYDLNSTQKQLLDLINQSLLDSFARNRHTVLIIDEAQLLSRDVLEQIRLLTNLETTKSKLLQIILIGQPELNDILSRNDLRQLAQRVTARYHLGALRQNEIEEYVNFRLSVAGCKKPLFSKQALGKLHALTDGIPRRINVLADHALLAAYSADLTMIDSKVVKAAANDVFIETAPQQALQSKFIRTVRKWWLPVTLLLLFNTALWWFFSADKGTDKSTDTSADQYVNQTTELAEQRTPAAPTPVVETAIEATPDTATPELEANVAVPATQDTSAENEVEITDTDRAAEAVEPAPDTTISSVTAADNGSAISVVNNTEVAPGKMLVADEFLDASPELPESIAQALAGDQPANTDTITESVSSDAAMNDVLLNSAFAAVLDTSADVTGRIAAFRNLALIWQQRLPETLLQTACEEVTNTGLRCLGVDRWEQLMNFNRPAIIVLSHRDQLHRVIVRSISADSAEVLVGSKVYVVGLPELRARWNGNAVLFWRPSEAGEGLKKIGDSGSGILATRRYLNSALEQSNMPLLASLINPDFDLDLSQKVFALQTRYGIAGDSRVGNETYLLMNEIVESESTPVLRNRLY